jgi:inosine-uridine nucleoside N-ribohydrolase
VKVHLDTDLGGDPDDVCALAMLLAHPGIEVAAITTTIDPGGIRAGLARYCLTLAGRAEIPVVAGAEATTGGVVAEPYGTPYWPGGISPAPSAPGAATEVLLSSIEDGAVIVGIGPCTNLAALEAAAPGALARARVVQMGGWFDGTGQGYPPWPPERDFNLQFDAEAAATVINAVDELTLVPITTTVKTHLRRRELSRLRASGPLGQLIADQSELYGEEHGRAALAREHPALPDDLLNFHHDPLTCAVAVGWEAAVEERFVRASANDGRLVWGSDGGRPVCAVTDVDGEAFAGRWLSTLQGS